MKKTLLMICATLTLTSNTTFAATDLQCVLKYWNYIIFSANDGPDTPERYNHIEDFFRLQMNIQFPSYGCKQFDQPKAQSIVWNKIVYGNQMNYITPRQLARAISQSRK
jgi:hypothetical protein